MMECRDLHKWSSLWQYVFTVSLAFTCPHSWISSQALHVALASVQYSLHNWLTSRTIWAPVTSYLSQTGNYRKYANRSGKIYGVVDGKRIKCMTKCGDCALNQLDKCRPHYGSSCSESLSRWILVIYTATRRCIVPVSRDVILRS